MGYCCQVDANDGYVLARLLCGLMLLPAAYFADKISVKRPALECLLPIFFVIGVSSGLVVRHPIAFLPLCLMEVYIFYFYLSVMGSDQKSGKRRDI